MSKEKKASKNSFVRDFLDILKFSIKVLIIIVPIRMFIAQPFIVNGESMLPTFNNGDYLIIDEITYRFEEPERGDVIVFKLPVNKGRYLIKRVIGLPGETVQISGQKVSITKTNGEIIEVEENYIHEDFSEYGTWELGEEEYFTMGDNRNNSSDSRSWGVLEKDLIIGKTLLRLFPFGDFAVKPGEFEPEQIEKKISE